MRGVHKLSALQVAKLSKPGRYGDGLGLWLQVSRWGTKAWLLRYEHDGRARHMGLGPLHTISLAEARERAREARKLLLDGIDPIEAKKAAHASAKADAARRITFRSAAEAYIEAQRAGWKNEKHADQWGATLASYAYPVIGELAVSAVETAHVLRILEPIWTKKTETASRVRGRVESILDWATAHHYRSADNPARWRGHLDKLLPAPTKVRRVKHQKAMPYSAVPAFVAELQALKHASALGLEFCILTACRTGEVIGAQWPEVDLDAKLWTIPGERTKSGREHRVPLPDRAIELLGSVPRRDGDDHVFIGAGQRRPLSNMALLELVRGMRPGEDLTVHGFRSSFRDWVAEQTRHPREIAEAALGHVLKDKTEAAYQRGDLLEKRRRLMRDWTRFCESRSAGVVVALHAAASP